MWLLHTFPKNFEDFLQNVHKDPSRDRSQNLSMETSRNSLRNSSRVFLSMFKGVSSKIRPSKLPGNRSEIPPEILKRMFKVISSEFTPGNPLSVTTLLRPVTCTEIILQIFLGTIQGFTKKIFAQISSQISPVVSLEIFLGLQISQKSSFFYTSTIQRFLQKFFRVFTT